MSEFKYIKVVEPESESQRNKVFGNQNLEELYQKKRIADALEDILKVFLRGDSND